MDVEDDYKEALIEYAILCAFISVWPYEPITVKVDHMLRKISKPHFRLPGYVAGVPTEFFEVGKCCHINFSGLTLFKELLKLYDAF